MSGSSPGHVMLLSLSPLHQREYIFLDTCSPRTYQIDHIQEVVLVGIRDLIEIRDVSELHCGCPHRLQINMIHLRPMHLAE